MSERTAIDAIVIGERHRKDMATSTHSPSRSKKRALAADRITEDRRLVFGERGCARARTSSAGRRSTPASSHLLHCRRRVAREPDPQGLHPIRAPLRSWSQSPVYLSGNRAEQIDKYCR